jgi:hypothetical protein
MRTQSICLALAIVLISPIASAQWVQTSLDSIVAISFATTGTNLFVGARGSDPHPSRGVFLSTDWGESWTRAGLTDSRVVSIAVSGPNLFAGTSGQGIFLSTNRGTTWTAVDSGLPTTYGSAVITLATSERNLLAGIDYPGPRTPLDTSVYGVWLSTNNGTSWTAANSGLRRPILALAVSEKKVLAGTNGEGVFISTDNGTSWCAVNSGLPTYCWVDALAVSDTSLFVATVPAVDSGGVFLSTNYGMNWTPVYIGLANTYVSCFAVSSSNLFAGTNRGVFLTTNSGAKWSPVNSGLADSGVFSLIVSGPSLFAGTASGVWKRPLSELITGGGSLQRFPHQYVLEQNYPNPVNPKTGIRFQVAGVREAGSGGLGLGTSVKLIVYDLLGREIAVLVNERKVPGNYEVSFDASGLSSGVYYYRLTAGSFAQTRSMMLVK